MSIKRFTLCLSAFIIALTMTTGQASALNKADYIPQGINYYGDEEASCASSSGSTVHGDSVEAKIWNYLVTKGLSGEQAAGIMGNMMAESGMVPTRHQGTGDIWNSQYTANAWGLVQWDGPRRFKSPDKGVLGKIRSNKPALEKYTALEYDYARYPEAKSKIPDADMNDLIAFELDYLYEESQVRPVTATGYGTAKSEWDALKLQKSVDDATVFWHNNFEVSNDSAATVITNRGTAAHKFFDEFSGASSSAPDASSSSSACSGVADTSSITSTIKSYAWPEYHEPDHIEMKPEYKTAVEAAVKKGEFIGGGINPGIDCGGFVTRVLHDSKFAPDYNDKNGAVSAAQVPWVRENGWKKLGTGSTINVADLRPGDVAFYNWAGNPDGDFFDHTAIFAGKIDGFGEKSPEYKGVASSSYGGETQGTGFWRSPMAGPENPLEPGAVWYRKA